MGRFKNDELMRLRLEFVLNAPPRLNEALGIGLFEGQTTLSKKRIKFFGCIAIVADRHGEEFEGHGY